MVTLSLTNHKYLVGEHHGDWRDTAWSTHESSQIEFQLKNSDESRLRWTAGIFILEEDNGIRFDIPHGSWGFTPQDQALVLSTFVQPERTLESFSGYLQGTFDITEDIRFTAGVRHTDDTREDKGGRSIDCTFYPGPGPLPTPVTFPADLNGAQGCWLRQLNDMDLSWDDQMYMSRLEWDLSDDMMLFLSYSTGWKSGVLVDGQGPLATATATRPVHLPGNLDIEGNNALAQEPEDNAVIELGIKSALLDGDMILNANVFFQTYDEMQVTSSVVNTDGSGESLRKTNAGEASMEGLELEMQWAVSEAGFLTVTGTFLQAEYDEFESSEGLYGDARGRTWNSCSRGVETDGTCTLGLFDYEGNTLPNAPDFALSASYKHDFVLGSDAVLTPRIRISHTDDMFLTQENRGDRPAGTNSATDPGEADFDTVEAQTIVDVSLTYTSPDERWNAELYIDNASDEITKTDQAISTGRDVSFNWWGPGREAGLRINFNVD